MGGLIPKDTFEQLARMQKKLEEVFQEVMNTDDFWGRGLEWVKNRVSVDVEESGHEYLLRIDLPGLDPKNFEINVDENSVTLKGSYSYEKQTDSKKYLLRERQTGAFTRRIPLQYPVIPDQAKAAYHQGVLEITVPKSGKAKAHGVKVPVKISK